MDASIAERSEILPPASNADEAGVTACVSSVVLTMKFCAVAVADKIMSGGTVNGYEFLHGISIDIFYI